jgi:hypothetical protein
MTLAPLTVDTVLGLLQVAVPAMQHPATDLATFASAVQLCAKDMTAVVGRAPDNLRPAIRMLGRSWCGDLQAKDALRALETGDLTSLAFYQSHVHDMAGLTPDAVALAHDFAADGARRGTTLIRRTAALLAAGRSQEASAAVTRAWASHAAIPALGGPLASVGAWRAHTGCVCPGILSGGACTCGACAPTHSAGARKPHFGIASILEDDE